MADPKSVALTRVFWLLDYDGSMCPHRESWEVGHYDPESLRQILDALTQGSAGVMWNTGRSVESLRTQSPHFLERSGFFEHGCYFWDGAKQKTLVSESLDAEMIKLTEDWVAARSEWVRFELKPQSLRLVPVSGQDRSRLRSEFNASDLKKYLVGTRGLRESEGWRALEIMLPAVSKANAVTYLLQHDEKFAGSVPVAVGDDIADSHVVAEVLARGGFAFLVGSHCGWIAEIPHRASQVQFFASPQELLEFLRDVVLRDGGLNPASLTKTKIPHALLDH